MLGRMTGIEPATTGTTNQGSTTELQPPNVVVGNTSECYVINIKEWWV
jgi:hypothetical protein